MIIINTSNKDHLPAIQAGIIQQVTIQHIPSKTRVKTGDVFDCEYLINGHVGSIGNARVTSVIRYQGKLVFENLRNVTLDSWAVREGFSSFKEADVWFTQIYGKYWKTKEFDTVYFRGDWLQEAY